MPWCLLASVSLGTPQLLGDVGIRGMVSFIQGFNYCKRFLNATHFGSLVGC
jgi:hypothetical protein